MAPDDPPCTPILEQVEHALRAHYGSQPARASVSFVGVEPIEILRWDAGGGQVSYVSLGMSRRPMTGADETLLSAGGPRAELLVQTHEAAGDIWRRLAVLAAAPVVEGVVHRVGMSVDLAVPLSAGSRCTGGVLVEADLPPVLLGDGVVVDVIRVIPATPTELAWCRVHGAAELVERWTAQGTDLLDLGRAAADLG